MADKIVVVYWSETGNTEAMANAIGEGIAEQGKQAVVQFVSDVTPDDLREEAVFAMGCPAMGDEVLEESEMEPFVEEVEQFVDGKTIALFGSYDWGDGEWMADWEDRMAKAGATVLNGQGLIVNNTPDDIELEECRKLGRQLANL